MNPVHYSSASNEWATPQDFFDTLNAEFRFALDAASTHDNAKCNMHMTEDVDALAQNWAGLGPVWVNPPYGRTLALWVAKAAATAKQGTRVVMLIPARPDTRYWHAHIWDISTHSPRHGVQVRFVKGRLKFGGSKNAAPFPSAVVVFG